MSLDQLQGHFGFSRLPFGRQIPAERLCPSRAHREAAARIAFVIAQGSIGLICGEVGSGKTTALRAATEPLDRSRHTVCYLPNPAVGERGIYQALICTLGGRVRFHKSELINRAYELLEREAQERAKQVTLAIDEAHLLSAQQLEESLAYVRHHLQFAGRSDALFSDDALEAIHQTARGIPRQINNLALQALIAAYAQGKEIVDYACAQAAIAEVSAE